MRSGTRTVLSVLSTCFLFWLGGRFLLPLCLPFLLGAALAMTAEPLVSVLCRRIHLPRPFAAGISVSVAFLGIMLLILLILAFLVRELGVLAGVLPDLTETARSGMVLLQNWMMDMAAKTPPGIRPLLQQNVGAIFSGGTALLEKAFSYVLGLAGTILAQVPDSALGLATTVISGFMISARLPRIRTWITGHVRMEKVQPLMKILARLRRGIGGWVGAQFRLAGVTLGILVAGLLFLRVPHGILLAFAISLVDAFPVLGTGTVLLPWALILWLQGDSARAVGVLGIYAIISVTRSVLEPKLVGRQLGLDPLITLFALYAGFKLWGLAGMILSPMLAVTVVQILPENRKK